MIGAALQTLKGHSGRVSSVAFSPDSKLAMSGSDDKTIRLWETMTGAAVQTLEGHSSRVSSVAFSPDGKLVVLGSNDKNVRLWDTIIGAALQTLEGHLGRISSVAFSLDGKLIVSGSDDETVRLWETMTGAALQTLNGYLGRVSSRLLRCLAFCVPPTFVRINPAGRFPCALCLQTLELYLNLIEALCHGPEFRGQVDSHDRAGGNSYSSF
jgi:WD40 repeat protein